MLPSFSLATSLIWRRPATPCTPSPGGSLHVHRTGVDLLAGPRLFARAWPRLCAGYVADAIAGRAKSWQRQDVGAVLEALAKGQAEPTPAVGPRTGSATPGWPAPHWWPKDEWRT
jgi:hypothetical protein